MDAGWAELEREVQPLTVPLDLRRVWERIDLPSLPVITYPSPSGIDFALWEWRGWRDEPEGSGLEVPVVLFPWCYTSHNHLLIELDAPDASGGAIFHWAFDNDAFRRGSTRSVRGWRR